MIARMCVYMPWGCLCLSLRPSICESVGWALCTHARRGGVQPWKAGKRAAERDTVQGRKMYLTVAAPPPAGKPDGCVHQPILTRSPAQPPTYGTRRARLYRPTTPFHSLSLSLCVSNGERPLDRPSANCIRVCACVHIPQWVCLLMPLSCIYLYVFLLTPPRVHAFARDADAVRRFTAFYKSFARDTTELIDAYEAFQLTSESTLPSAAPSPPDPLASASLTHSLTLSLS
jgi:hypothetical protein